MGHFITFEGIEACGKSTQIQLLGEWLVSLGKRVTMTREPGGTELGEQIRTLLKSGSLAKFFSPKAELLLFEANRAQHVEEKILPAMARGDDVLCDRFLDSSAVYQGMARKIQPTIVEFLNNFASGNLLPDLTIIIDISPEESLRRLATRGYGADRIECEDLKFFETIREGYLGMAKNDPRFAVVDGTGDVNDIQDEIRREYRTRFM
jgi:dTMP kinase